MWVDRGNEKVKEKKAFKASAKANEKASRDGAARIL
jgi:hypothetical protein